MDQTDKQWCCRNNHVLGFISQNGNGVTQLRVLRHAIDLNSELPAEVDVLGSLTGRMPVHCDVRGCGDVRLWEVSAKAALDLIARVDAQRLEAFVSKMRQRRQTYGKGVRDGKIS